MNHLIIFRSFEYGFIFIKRMNHRVFTAETIHNAIVIVQEVWHNFNIWMKYFFVSHHSHYRISKTLNIEYRGNGSMNECMWHHWIRLQCKKNSPAENTSTGTFIFLVSSRRSCVPSRKTSLYSFAKSSKSFGLNGKPLENQTKWMIKKINGKCRRLE